MKTAVHQQSSEAAIWDRIVGPDAGVVARATARILLDLDFSTADRERMDDLSEKASAGTLTPLERTEAETYNRVAHLLALLQSKARQSLRAGQKR